MKKIEYNGKSIEYYDYYYTPSSCTISFFNANDGDINDFFGTNIIPYLKFINDETNTSDAIQLNMKLKSSHKETGTIIKKKYDVVKASYYTEDPVIDVDTGKQIVGSDGIPLVNNIFHPAEIKTTTSEDNGIITRVILEPPSIYDTVDSISLNVERQAISLAVAKISAQSFSDVQALEVKDIYPTFDELVSQKYISDKQGFKFTYKGDLYKTAQQHLAFQAQYVPGQGTESLYTHIDEIHAGTVDDPIPAVSNMQYFKDKYYIENSVIYLCNSELAKDGIVLQFTPSQLIGTYFEVIEGKD